jgi:hypothetical protein
MGDRERQCGPQWIGKHAREGDDVRIRMEDICMAIHTLSIYLWSQLVHEITMSVPTHAPSCTQVQGRIRFPVRRKATAGDGVGVRV